MFKEENAKLRRHGLAKGMVVVALDGWRVDNFMQYSVIRALSDEPRMTLTVWDGSRYQDKTVEVASRRFDVDMRDY